MGCRFGTFEPAGKRYWAAVLKTVDAETLVLTNVNQSNAASPDTDDMNVDEYMVRLWGVTIPEGDKEQAAELRRKLTPPGSWVKVITIGGKLLQDQITEVSLANHHDWSLNLDLLHLAVMGRQGVTRIVTADVDFGRVPGVVRLDPVDLGEWEPA